MRHWFQSFLSFVVLSIPATGGTQNIVINPGFEEFGTCPPGYGDGGPLYCEPWVNGNLATADYFNACANGTDVGVPDNFFGSQGAHTGVGYAGFYTRESSIWREYVQVSFTEPCIAGYSYEVGFFVSLADLYCGVENIGAYLSVDPPPGNTIGTLGVTPQIQADLGFINETNDWVLITGCFTAQGGEQWITIGNFQNNAETPLQPGCTASFASYYYIDDVSVIQGDEVNDLELELGDPVTTCEPYVIDPDVSNVSYLWSDGSTGATLTVTESGMYYLTITAGCGNIGTDSVEIIFIGASPVDLGPDQITLCDGQEYTISLDPDAGDYTWNDGTMGPEYTISQSGTYTVTLDDGCDLTTDAITVEFFLVPEQFSLGDDAALCMGDELTFSFDPDLGNFLWQDNSMNAEYTVSNAGTYSLTISNACGSATDQIEITILDAPHVDLGADFAVLCTGEELNLDLDPLLGTYLWQDGSTSSSYAISLGGIYSVTVTNGCGSADDAITVTQQEPPENFSLGDDQFLCEGTEIGFSFDENFGNFAWQDGSDDATYVIQTPGEYQLTISNSCGIASDTLIVTGIPLPVVELGEPSVNLCDGELIEYHFDPDAGEYLWQDGSTTPDYTVQVPGTYSVTLSNICGLAADEITVQILDLPEATLGPDVILCPGQFPLTLTAGNTVDATYIWQNGSGTPTFHVSEPGIYAVTVSNSCGTVSDAISISVSSESPQVNLPEDQILCPGETLLLQAGSALGEYLWQDGSTEESFLAIAEGIYSVTVTNTCGSDADTIVITFAEEMNAPDLGPDITLCPGTPIILRPGNSGQTYIWSNGSNADTLIAESPGIYWVMATGICGTITDTIELTLQSGPPQLELPESIALCPGDTIVLDPGINGVSYFWSNGLTTSSITISGIGSFSVTVSSACGSDTAVVQILDAGESPFVSLGPDTVLCQGSAISLIPNSSGVENWLWHNGTTDSSLLITQPGIVAVLVSNTCGTASDTMIVTQENAPVEIDLGNDVALCPGQHQTLFLTHPAENILWSDGSMTPSVVVHDSGWVSVMTWNACGIQQDSLYVSSLPGLLSLDLGHDQFLCPGETFLLDPAIPDVEYEWNNGSTLPTFIVDTPGEIVLTISNLCGSISDTLQVTADDSAPVVSLGEDHFGCEGDTIVLHANILGVEYVWQDGSTASAFEVTSPGTYHVTISNACGENSDTVVVAFNTPPAMIDLGPDTALCTDEVYALQVNEEPGLEILWNNGSESSMLNVDQSGTYWVEVQNQCGSVQDTVEITILPAVDDFDLGRDTAICQGEMLLLNGPLTPWDYQWQDGNSGTGIVVDASGQYWLQISNRCGIASDTIHVTVNDETPRDFPAERIAVCAGEAILLNAQQPFDAYYRWNTGDTTPTLETDLAGIYTVTITSNCMQATAQYFVEEKQCAEEVFIPNVFSPNGDAVNDLFEVLLAPSLDVVHAECSVFDRWGNHIFHTEQVEISWDGTFRNETVAPGVYVYVVIIDAQKNGRAHREVYKGDVTVVR